MDTTTSRYRSCREAVNISEIRWPDLRRGLIKASDAWLTRLEELTLRELRPVPGELMRLRLFLAQGGVPVASQASTARMQECVCDFLDLIFSPHRLALLSEEEGQSGAGEEASGNGTLLSDEEPTG